MRHVLTATAVIVVSVFLALTWMTPAVAKKASDPGAAITKAATKAANRTLKVRLREIKALSRDTSKQLRALANAVKKGKAPPVAGVVAKSGTEYTPEEILAFTERAGFLLRYFPAQLQSLARELRRELLTIPEVQQLLFSNETRPDRLPFGGGAADQMTGAIESACNEACAEVNTAFGTLCQAFADRGIELTGGTCPLGKIAPLSVSLDEFELPFAPGILEVYGYGGTLEGCVQYDYSDPNSTVTEMRCYDPEGLLEAIAQLQFDEERDIGTFSFKSLPRDVYLLQLGTDCPDGFVVIDQLHVGVGAAPPSGGGSSNPFDFTESSATVTKNDQPFDPVEVDGAMAFNTQNGLTSIELRLFQAGTTDDAFQIVLDIPDGLDNYPASRFLNYGDQADEGIPTHQITVTATAADGTRFVQPEGRTLQTELSIAARSDLTIGFLSPPKMIFIGTFGLVPETTPEAPEVIFLVRANLIESDVEKP